MQHNSKEKLIANEAPPPSYNSNEDSSEDVTKIDINEKPPKYSEYPPRPQMGTNSQEVAIDLPENRNAVDENGRPIHCYRGGAHEWEESYAGWGICLAIFCCPCGGIYCCHKLKNAKCKKCGYYHEAFPDEETKPDPGGEQARRIGFLAGYLSSSLT